MAATVTPGPAHAKVMAIFLDGIDLSGRSRDLNTQVEGNTVDITGMGAPVGMWREFIAGLRGWTQSIEGIYETAAPGADDEIGDALDDIVQNDSTVMSVMHLGDEIGRVAAFAGQELDANGNVIRTAFNVQGGVEDAVTVSGELASKGSILFGFVVKAKLLITTFPFTGDGVDGTADGVSFPTTNGGVGFLHVFDVTTNDTLTVKIRDSDDDITYGDLVDFTAVAETDGPTAEPIAVSGDVEKFVNCEATISGAGSNEATFAAGFVRL